MSRKGNCFHNAAFENFFGTLKAEYFHLAAPDSIDALEAGMHDYIHYYMLAQPHQRGRTALGAAALLSLLVREPFLLGRLQTA